MRCFWMTAIVAVLGACAAVRGQVILRDDFTSAQLQSGWQVLNESAANHSLSARSGFLRISTQRGALEEDNHINNLVVRQFTGNFFLETKLEFNPRAAQQFAGLLVYESQTNAAALGLTFVSGERGAFRGLALVSAELAGSNTQPPVQRYDESNAANPNLVYLRLLRSGDQLVAGYSQDGVTFTDFGSIINEFPATVLVGVGATNGDFETCGQACDTPIAADFDYFQIAAFGENPGNDVVVEDLVIEGPQVVTAGEAANYTATAQLSDGSEEDVTVNAQWIIAPPGNGTISGGALSAGLVPTARYVTVVATYSFGPVGSQDTIPAAYLVEIVPAGAGDGGSLCGLGLLSALPGMLLPLGAVRLRRAKYRA